MYKTKTEKKNALKSVHQKAKKLFLTGLITTNQLMQVEKMCKDGMRKL